MEGGEGGGGRWGFARTPATGVGGEGRTSDVWGRSTRAQLAGLERDTVRECGGAAAVAVAAAAGAEVRPSSSSVRRWTGAVRARGTFSGLPSTAVIFRLLRCIWAAGFGRGRASAHPAAPAARLYCMGGGGDAPCRRRRGGGEEGRGACRRVDFRFPLPLPFLQPALPPPTARLRPATAAGAAPATPAAAATAEVSGGGRRRLPGAWLPRPAWGKRGNGGGGRRRRCRRPRRRPRRWCDRPASESTQRAPNY